MGTYLPDQRVSNKEKATSKWYEPTMDYWVDKALSYNDKTETLRNLNAANGIIDNDTYQYVLAPLSADSLKDKNLPGEIRDVDFLTPIKEKNIGEYIELPYRFFVTVNNADAVLGRNEAVRKEFARILEGQLLSLVQNQEMEQVDIGKHIEDFKTKWLDKRAINGQHILKLINDFNDFDVFRIQGFFNWWATEEFYTYRYIQNGELYKEIINPLEGYPVDNGEAFVEDNDGFVINRKITIQQFLEKYSKLVDKDQLAEIEELSRRYNSLYDGTNVVLLITDDRKLDFYSGELTDYGKEAKRTFGSNDEIEEDIVIFKTQVKKRILFRISEVGEVDEVEVDDTYKLDKPAGDIKIDTEWINEIWKGYRFGGKAGVYIEAKPEAVQRYDSRNHCKLPVGGKKGLLNGNFINPVPRRILPYLALYRIFTLQQERAIAKYKGDITAIPQSAMNDTSDLSVGERYFYMYADNVLIYDDSVISPQEMSVGFKAVGGSGLREYISTLRELSKDLVEEANSLANMNDYRQGNIRPDAGKGITEQGIYRAKLGSVLMIQMFNSALEKEHNADLEYSKVAFIEGKTGTYLNEDGTPALADIDGRLNMESDYGVYVKNGMAEQKKVDEYKQYVGFSASQSGDFELAAAAIEADNIPNLREIVEKYTQGKREFEQSMKEQEAKNAQQAMAMQEEGKSADREAKINEIITKESMVTEREIMKLQAALADGDQVGIDNAIKSANQALGERKQMLEERKVDAKQQDDTEKNRLKDKEIDANVKIATVNKN